MALLEFVFSGFWTFIGVLILAMVQKILEDEQP